MLRGYAGCASLMAMLDMLAGWLWWLGWPLGYAG
jgi:hypothetical protein